MGLGGYAFRALLVVGGPFFPPSLIQPVPHVDTRRCTLGAHPVQSDCALIGSQWVVTTAGTVATARPVAGRLHVRIGDDDFAVEQLIYHPKWNGGVKHDVTLLKLSNRVPAFPLLPLPGEFPVHVQRIARHAMSERQWVAQTIGPSPLWTDPTTPALATKPPTILTRMRSLVDGWVGRASND